MSQSDEQGFHQSSIEMFTVKTRHFQEVKQSKARIKNAYLYRSPLSLYHQLQLYEYPKHLDLFNDPKQYLPQSEASDPCDLVNNDGEIPVLLSEFFPRLPIAYNRFGQNLILKRDTTIVIRNIASRIRNDQLITFHERSDPPHSATALQFTANFEGGNLHCVFRERASGRYYLLLQNDVNTHGYNIWFHFNVKAYQAGSYQFIIANLAKEVRFAEEISLLAYSSKSGQYSREIGFRCVETKFRHCQSAKRFWSIHFAYTFEAGEDVYLSLCPPYTFSKLLRLLKQVSQPFYQNISVTAEIAGKSELGNYIPCLRVAAKERPSRNCIIITARQHPCETVGSFVCEQIIKTITDNSALAHELTQAFTFYVFPMVNPDGVIHGNSRTNLMGYDINRSWDAALPTETAEAVQIWEYIVKIIEEGNQIAWSFDLHGHSKELGFFAYFCEENQSTLLLNYHLSARPGFYQQEKCGFNLSKLKRESIRGQLFSRLKVPTAVTVETSYYGFRDQHGTLVQFSQRHFQQIAHQLLQSILATDTALKNKAQKQEILQNIRKPSRQCSRASQKYYQPLQVDSDSDPEEDYLRKDERSQVRESPFLKNNFKFRTRTEYNSRGRSSVSETFYKQKKQSEVKKGHFGSSSFNKSSTIEQAIEKDKQKTLTFYAGRRTLSPHILKKTQQKTKLRRKIDVNHRIRTQIPPQFDDEEQENLKKSFELRRTLRQQQEEKRLKTYVGGFRTCYQVLGLRTIVYPTATSAGIDFQNSLKSKKQIIKEIRGRQLQKGSHRRKLSETYYNQIKKKF